MTPTDFLSWRKSLDLTQEQAGVKLGKSKRSIVRYEIGTNERGAPAPVPLSVELACKWLEQQWRPIESAPKDGRMALVYRPFARKSHDEPVAIKRLIDGNSHCWDCTVPEGQQPTNPTDGACHVTHYKPLPQPPEAK